MWAGCRGTTGYSRIPGTSNRGVVTIPDLKTEVGGVVPRTLKEAVGTDDH